MAAQDEKTGENIFGRHSTGLQNVGSYQVAGVPWVTGSDDLDAGGEHTITFPLVTKSILVRNPGAVDIRVHFASKADTKVYSQNHFLRISGSATMLTELELDCKCTKLYISNATAQDNAVYEVFAELTGIDPNRMFDLTGSGITE